MYYILTAVYTELLSKYINVTYTFSDPVLASSLHNGPTYRKTVRLTWFSVQIKWMDAWVDGWRVNGQFF